MSTNSMQQSLTSFPATVPSTLLTTSSSLPLLVLGPSCPTSIAAAGKAPSIIRDSRFSSSCLSPAGAMPGYGVQPAADMMLGLASRKNDGAVSGHEKDMSSLPLTKSVSYAKAFALFGAVYSFNECVIEKFRARHDRVNPALAGCATGAMLAYSGRDLVVGADSTTKSACLPQPEVDLRGEDVPHSSGRVENIMNRSREARDSSAGLPGKAVLVLLCLVLPVEGVGRM
ncbi:hypothetical protein CEUSTIGMA_g6107.t1 [Chlamydomonas eustigma]|uniref:Mitochondrial import inner membrane translocase subunit TIM22 n=1 Tax=Chlamydomonas eustigma TaxID=1157962 RepID=A0A250X6X9_9CHLO|nr:hypothetical protein CEUSTIGMA_g6107.t1 [Chlamydomonas eustigma]|eukprot:GAX78669.1 hypothetical protein CEUSTIGMA_g6107.t1 [Chlamydomonas eustigma]